VNDSALSFSDAGVESARAALVAGLDSIPNDVPEPLPDLTNEPAPVPVVANLDPWASTNVAWLVPLAGKLLQLPYEQVAKRTHDDCWLVTDDQLEVLNPSLENALKWTVWRIGAANTIGHPLLAFGVAMASLTAVKYGMYQMNQLREKEGGPGKIPRPQQPASVPLTTGTATMKTNGKMGESGGESSSAASPRAESPISLSNGFVIVEE
jgi:hypothetical protein